MKDRLATKDAQIREYKRAMQADMSSSIYMAGANRRSGGPQASQPAHGAGENELVKLHQEREELLAQLDRLRNQNLALNRTLINQQRRGGELQEKIQKILKREAASHDRNTKLADALRKAGEPMPYGTALSPEERRQFEYDQRAFVQAAPPPPLVEREVLTPDAEEVKRVGDHGKGTEATTRAIAHEMQSLQEDAAVTLAKLRASNHDLEATQTDLAEAMAELEGKDELIKSVSGEKALVLAMLLSKMGVVKRLAEELEAAKRALLEKEASRGLDNRESNLSNTTRESSIEQLRATDEASRVLETQLGDLEQEYRALMSERDELADAAADMSGQLEGRRKELAAVREQAAALIEELENLAEAHAVLEQHRDLALGEKVRRRRRLPRMPLL